MVAELRLSPAQERSIAQSTARINIWDGSVRSGKTVGSLLRWLMYVARAPRGGALVVVGKTLDTVHRNVFGPLTDPAVTGPAARLIKYTRGAATATILGRTIEVITANNVLAEGRLRGLTCAGAYVDEATLIPENFWNQLLARLSVPGAQLFATTNPDNPGHWLRKKFILRAGDLDLRYWHFTLDDNHALDPAYVANLKREHVGLWRRRFIFGEWVQAEGAVYDMWDPDRHVIDVLPPITNWIGLGVDYGTVAPFAGLLLGVGRGPAPNDPEERTRLYLAGEYRYDSRAHRRQLTDVEYSRRLRDWLADFTVGPGQRGVRPEWTVVDPSAASFVTQLYHDGLTPTLADNGVLDGIRLVSSLLANDLLLVRGTCHGWIEEAGGYAWDDKAAAAGEDKPVKADDHSLDAGRYVLKTTEFAWRNQLDWALAA
jgi:PBSX family phage terminase large subunit